MPYRYLEDREERERMIHNGDIIDNQYQIVREIGAGGVGIIYLAYHMRLCKYVVLKKIKNAGAGFDTRKEVDLLKSLHHAYLPQVYDYLQWGQDIYTVIDYIEGHDLEWYIKNGYQFEEQTIVKWLRQMGEVLVYLHSQSPKVIHCDIKPANIIINSNGDAILIDFNISFLENTSGVVGLSRIYASPEQTAYAMQMQMCGYSQVEVDERTDIYSLGVTFYHIMTGLEPSGQNRQQYPVLNLELPYKSVVCKIISRMMEENKEHRYKSAKELVKVVNNIHKSTWQYRAFISAVAILVLSAAVLLTAAGIHIYDSSRQKKHEEFLSDYNHVAENYELQITARQFELVTGILNNADYKQYLDEDSEKKAMLLFFLADYYVSAGNYPAAEKYYEESINTKGVQSVYKEYAVVLADEGKFAEARGMLKKAELSETEYGMLLAQFLCDEGKYKEAAEAARKIENSVKGKEKITILKLELYCYQQLGEDQKVKQYYEELEKTNGK